MKTFFSATDHHSLSHIKRFFPANTCTDIPNVANADSTGMANSFGDIVNFTCVRGGWCNAFIMNN